MMLHVKRQSAHFLLTLSPPSHLQQSNELKIFLFYTYAFNVNDEESLQWGTVSQSDYNINHDDASGFRLDTMATHTSPMVQGEKVLTTHTDYVNRYTVNNSDIQ
jgi:hypothetical protein